MGEAAGRAGRGAPELSRMLATLLWVAGSAAATIAALGALPRWLAGDGGAARAVTVDEAERRLGARLPLPAYYPDRLAWPPSEIRVAGGRGGSALLRFAARDAGAPVELLAATDPVHEIDAGLLEGRTVVSERRTVVGSRPATLASVLVDGVSWQELSFELDGRRVILRTRGDLEELVRMAKSLHTEGRR
jgi:hypothetical protein